MRRDTYGFLTVVALLNFASAQAEEPISAICGSQNGVHVRVVGNKNDLVEVWDRSRRVFKDYTPARDAAGGIGTVDCKDVAISGDTIAVRLGHRDDILHAFKLIRGANGQVAKVGFLVWAVRDGSLTGIRIEGGDVLMVAGRNSDIRYRICPDWEGQTGVWGIFGHRGADYPLCNARFPDSPQRNGYVLVLDVPAAL